MKAKQPSKALTVEDSFKSCTSVVSAKHVLQILVPDLLAKLRDEYEASHSHLLLGVLSAWLVRSILLPRSTTRVLGAASQAL